MSDATNSLFILVLFYPPFALNESSSSRPVLAGEEGTWAKKLPDAASIDKKGNLCSIQLAYFKISVKNSEVHAIVPA